MSKEEQKTPQTVAYFERSLNAPGPMVPIEQISKEEVLDRVSISAVAMMTADRKGLVRVTMKRGGFVDSYTFAVDTVPLMQKGIGPRDVVRLDVTGLEALGFAFNGEYLGMKDGKNPGKYEARYRVVNTATKETYIITESLADHWQPSHSHKSFTEKYYWTQKRIASRSSFSLFSENKDGTMTQTEIYQMPLISIVRTRRFKKNGSLVKGSYKARLLLGDAVETEAGGIAHNVFIKAGTIIGTSKVLKPGIKLADGEVDWQARPEFDKTLTAAFAN